MCLILAVGYAQCTDTSAASLLELGGRGGRRRLQPWLGTPLRVLFQEGACRSPGTCSPSMDPWQWWLQQPKSSTCATCSPWEQLLPRAAGQTSLGSQCPSLVAVPGSRAGRLPIQAAATSWLLTTLEAGTQRLSLSSLMSKTTESRAFLAGALALGTVAASLSSRNTSNFLHISVTMTKTNPWGDLRTRIQRETKWRTSEDTRPPRSRWQSARWRCPWPLLVGSLSSFILSSKRTGSDVSRVLIRIWCENCYLSNWAEAIVRFQSGHRDIHTRTRLKKKMPMELMK